MINEEALLQLAGQLKEAGYSFTTVTPLTHARVLRRPSAEQGAGPQDEGRTLRDIFGWSRPFERAALPPQIFGLLEQAGAVTHVVDEASSEPTSKLVSGVRFSTLRSALGGDQLYVHSAYPTTQADSVFFGPDTYRFVSLIERELADTPVGGARRILDIGCGAGPGGITAAQVSRAQGTEPELLLGDINPAALAYASVNAKLAGLEKFETVQSDLYAATGGQFDLILANPPYLVDADARVYRHGGGEFGTDLALRIVAEGVDRLSSGGRLILYTGAPIVHGEDVFRKAVLPPLENRDFNYRYSELDPDVFGEELENPGYENVERIAAVALVISRQGS